jgi:hypothetical protein
MIRFIKEVYLTGFTIMFKISRAREIKYKAGSAIAVVALVESFALMGIQWHVEILLNRRFLLPKPAVAAAFVALALINIYILFVRGHGLKFAEEFKSLAKSRRVILATTFVIVSVATIVFGVWSAVAYRHFFGLG